MDLDLLSGAAVYYAPTVTDALRGAVAEAQWQFNTQITGRRVDIRTFSVSHSIAQLPDGTWCVSVLMSVMAV